MSRTSFSNIAGDRLSALALALAVTAVPIPSPLFHPVPHPIYFPLLVRRHARYRRHASTITTWATAPSEPSDTVRLGGEYGNNDPVRSLTPTSDLEDSEPASDDLYPPEEPDSTLAFSFSFPELASLSLGHEEGDGDFSSQNGSSPTRAVVG